MLTQPYILNQKYLGAGEIFSPEIHLCHIKKIILFAQKRRSNFGFAGRLKVEIVVVLTRDRFNLHISSICSTRTMAPTGALSIISAVLLLG